MRTRFFNASEARVVWYSGCFSLLITVAAFLPSTALRLGVVAAGMIGSVMLAPSLLPRVSPLGCVVLTGIAALAAVVALMGMSGLSLTSGRSASQAGAHLELTWFFTAIIWCFDLGLVAACHYVARVGKDAGHLSQATYRRVHGLLAVVFVGFAIVGGMSVSHNRVFSVVHNVAAVISMVPFWLGIAASVRRLAGVSASLRRFSAIAAFAIAVPWFPTLLEFFGVIPVSPVPTLHMELTVFALTFVWLGWLAREWSAGSLSLARAGAYDVLAHSPQTTGTGRDG